MGIALITAGGVIAAALIGIIVSLIQANERTTRLLREAETLAKLESGTWAHTLMQRHIEWSIGRYAIDARVRAGTGGRVYLAVGGVFFGFAIAVWAYVREHFDTHQWELLYWWVLAFLVIGSFAMPGIAWWGNIRDIRESRKVKNATDNQDEPASDG